MLTVARRRRSRAPEKGRTRVISANSSANYNPMIPRIVTSSSVNHTFRYTTNATVAAPGTSVTRGQMLNALIMNAGGGTTNGRITNAIKLNSISIWSIAGGVASGTPVATSCSIEWLSEYGPSKLIIDTSINPAVMAMIHSKPPPGSLAGFWSVRGSNESTVLFNITAVVNAVVDVNVTYNIQDDTSVTSVTTAASGANLTVYATYLDGPRSGAVFAPVGLPSLN
jgi:hypothetical protein